MNITISDIVIWLENEAQKAGRKIRVRGNLTCPIFQVAPLQSAVQGQIAFLANPRYRQHLQETRASAVILSEEMLPFLPESTPAVIISSQPYADYARVASLLNPPEGFHPGIHPSAVLESNIPESCYIGAGVFIGPGVFLDENIVIHANTVINKGASIGEDSIIYGNVTIYAGCKIGKRAILHSGAVIGADGFGFAPEGGKWLKIPQIGRVIIGDDVEIGANTTIDRGAMGDTIIGNGCKLDNHIQIAHNCVIGEGTVIAGCAGIAGSTHIGHHCAIGGAAMIAGHLKIAPRTEISPASLIMKNIPKEGGKYTAIYPLDQHEKWLHNAFHVKHLAQLAERVDALEKKVGGL